MIATHCPDRNRLHKFLSGQLDHETSAELEQHLEDCQACEQTIEQLETEPDTIVEVLRTWNASSAEDPSDQAPEFLAAQKFAASLAERLRPAGSLKLATSPVIGAYELVDILGQGGMGTVYLARHCQLDKQVAIKLLPAISARQQAVVTRFQREIRAAGKLDHPAIVRATDAGEVDGVHFLVMDVIDGLDVGQVCRNVGPLSVANACEIVRQAAVGLAYAHGQGVVHRDVKPSNLMLNSNGQVKILDFGLAQMSVWTDEATQLTTVGQLMGTLDYMAPEQAEGSQAPSERADIYALGATLFRLLTGRPPLSASATASPLEKLRLIASHDPPSIDSLRSDLPPKLSQLVMQMLARDPAQRPQTAQEVAEQLSAFCEAADLVRLVSVAEEAAQEPTNFASESDQASSPQPRPSAGKPPGSIWKWVALASFGALLIFGAVFTLETSKGQLIIDSKDADLHVKLLKDGQVYRELEIHPGVQVTKLYSGNYEIVLDQASDGVAISQQRFEIKLGDRVVATISKQPTEPVPSDQPKIGGVKLATVESRTVTFRDHYAGKYQKPSLVYGAAKEDGYVAKTLVKAMQEVKKGEPLFETVPIDKEGDNKDQSPSPTSVIHAPFDGYVATVIFEKGDKIKKGDRVLFLFEKGPLLIDFNIATSRYDEYVGMVTQGKLKIELLGQSREVIGQGTVTKLEGVADGATTNAKITATPSEWSAMLRLRTQTVSFSLVRETIENAVVVPQKATFKKLGKRYLYIVDDQHIVHRREIVVERDWEDQFVVASGVTAGEEIVLEGLHIVSDGRPIVEDIPVKPAAKTVEVAAVESKTVTVRNRYFGRLPKRALGFVAPDRDGVVKNVNVHLGQEVKKGDLIAEVVSTDNDNEIEAIQAPFDAFVIGLKVAEGDKVKKGDMLTLLSASGPAIVDFDISQDDRLEFVQSVLNGDVKIELVFDKNEKKYDHLGKLTKVDGKVDSHGIIELQAEFPNPEGKVGTGTQAWIETNPTLENATLIPKEAWFRKDHRTCVFVVDGNQIAHLRDITVLNSWEDYYVIKSGVSPGEMVVVAGVSQVQDGENITTTILEKPTADTGDEADKLVDDPRRRSPSPEPEVNEAEKPTAKPVKVAAVEAKTVTVTYRYLGHLQKRALGFLSPERDGIVDKMNVHLGQEVKKGDLIAEVVSADNERQAIRAPFDAFVIGLKAAKGDKVNAGDMLVFLSASGPAIVDFDISEASRLEFIQWVVNDDVKMELVFENNDKKYDQPGKLSKIDGKVDSHGNIELQAEFPNPEGKVDTGTLVYIEINPTLENATIIPKQAVFRQDHRSCVFVVDDNQIAHLRDVKVNNEWEDYYVIKSGVNPGESIVVAGVSQVQDGENVAATNLEKPTAEAANTNDEADKPVANTSRRSVRGRRSPSPKPEAAEAEKPTAKPVKVAAVEAKTVTVTFHYLGRLHKRALRYLTSERDGVVDKLDVSLGQKVKKGDVIAEVVSADNEKEAIQAPFDAFVIGLKAAKGDKLKKGDMLVLLSASGPAIVDFDISESSRLEFVQWVLNDDAKLDLVFRNYRRYDHPGKLTKVDGMVSSGLSHTVELQAEFPNPEGKVGLGPSVWVEVHPTFTNATLVPKQAVVRKDNRSYVLVVDENHIAHERRIVTLNSWEDQYVIRSGVDVGEQIVVEGASNVQDGQKVVVTNPQKPSAKAESPAAKSIKVASVERKPVSIQHQYGAKLVDRNVYPVKPAMDGVLGKRLVDSGQSVKKDDVLFEMTPSTAAEGESIEVKAPADGTVWSIFYHSGSFAKRGESVMYVVQKGPITAEFNVPERRALEYLNLRSTSDLKIELVSVDGHRFDQLGVISKMGREVNPKTGNVPFEATFDNLQGAIRITQSGTILVRRTIANATVVPQQATFEKDGKRYLFVVDNNHIAHQREIFVESETEDLFVIQSGVNADEQIVVEGVRQVHDGEKVVPTIPEEPAAEAGKPAREAEKAAAEAGKRVPKGVNVANVEAKTVTIRNRYFGQIHKRNLRYLDAEEDGYVGKLHVTIGQEVKQGDVIFETVTTEHRDETPTASPTSAIKSPFDAFVIGLKVKQGEKVKKGDRVMLLSARGPATVDFDVTEAQYLDYIQMAKEGDLKIELVFASGKKYDQPGKLTKLGGKVNPLSGDITMQAEFPNPEGKVGVATSATILICPTVENVTTVPKRAVFPMNRTPYVYVIDDQKIAHKRLIFIENETDDDYVIESGVNVGEQIVVDGLRQVHDGEQVAAIIPEHPTAEAESPVARSRYRRRRRSEEGQDRA